MKYLTYISLTFLLLTAAWHAEAKELIVCPDGCTYSSIQEAVKAAESGDTVSIKSGLYKEGTIEITKPLLIRGIGEPVLDGEGKHEILTITANNVTVRGLLLRNTGSSFMEDRSAISLEKSQHCVIEDNRLEDTFFGIYLLNSRNCTIRNNKIYGKAKEEATSGNAIHLWYSDSMHIEGNEAMNHRDGIYLEFVKSSYIENNISRGNLRYGLHFMFSDFNQYVGNTFEQNGAGVAVMFSKGIRMEQNRFVQNWGTASYGLLLKEIYDSEIKGNSFTKNTVGIFSESVTRCNITRNDFSRNGWAIRMSGSSMDNTISRNNFFSNTFDVSTSARENHNLYSENYWSDYTGYDLDRDQIGDVPYRPVKLFSYLVGEIDTSVLLLRSFFIDMLNYAEKIMPALTPADLLDEKPLMRPVQ